MRSVQQLRQRALSLFDRFSTEILPVEFEEIERTKGDSMIVLAPTYISKTAKPFSSQAMASPSTTQERAGRAAIALVANGKRLVKLYPVAGNQPHAAGVAPSNDAETVMLDFMQPAQSRGRLCRRRGRQGSKWGWDWSRRRRRRSSRCINIAGKIRTMPRTS